MLFVGILTGLVAVLIDFMVERLTDFKYGLIAKRIII